MRRLARNPQTPLPIELHADVRVQQHLLEELAVDLDGALRKTRDTARARRRENFSRAVDRPITSALDLEAEDRVERPRPIRIARKRLGQEGVEQVGGVLGDVKHVVTIRPGDREEQVKVGGQVGVSRSSRPQKTLK